ncbi:MAG: ribonuclease [Bacteroidetes bacterium]|jgi:membrane protein|nr:ribonuclease [Bacteroidota bacterium]
MKKKLKDIGTILKKTAKGWNADDPFRQSAVIAYYAIFSLPALLVLLINIMGFFFERDAISGEISRQIEGVMGPETANTVERIVERAGETKSGIFASIIAIVTILFGATGVFIQLQKTLNQIWDVREKPDLGFMKQLKIRLFSFGLILSVGFLLLTSLVVSTALAALSHQLEGIFPEAIAYLFYGLEFVISLGVISVLFALMFKLLPDVKMTWKTVWIGAFLTGLLFLGGKYGLSLYFGKAEPGSVYGAAGSIILMLLWVSYSSMIVFFGAEFTKQYAVHYGLKFGPSKDAVKIDDEVTGTSDSNIEREHKEAAMKEKQSVVSYSENGHTDKRTISSNGHHENNDIREPKKVPIKYETNGNGKHEESPVEMKIQKLTSRKKKITSVQDLKDEIVRKEIMLKENAEGIKDDLKPSHLFSNLLPRPLRVKHFKSDKWDMDEYMRGVARNYISTEEKEKSFLDKVKELLHIGNGKT